MASHDERAERWIVTGRVQGVAYRWFTREAASELGVRGFARNLPDGSVEVQVQAAEPALGDLHRRLLEGPPHAKVEKIERRALDHEEAFRGFEIRF